MAHVVDTPRLGKNNDHFRRLNRELVVSLLRAHGEMSRADLTRATALTAQSVSNIVGDLEAGGLIEAADKVYGGKGQPATPYRLRPGAGAGVGVHLDQGRLAGAVVDFGLSVLAERDEALPVHEPSAVARRIVRFVESLIVDAGVVRDSVWGVGLASPRLLDERVQHMDLLEGSLWAAFGRYGLDARLSEATGLPLFVENDANAGALGELTFGGGRGLSEFCYLYLGQGLGCGIVSGGHLRRGAWGNAGEIGLFPLGPGPGAVALEQVLSVQGHEARRGEDAWLREAAPCLRWAVGLLENFCDPEAILIASDLADDTLDRLIAAVEPLPETVSVRSDRVRPRIARGTLSRHAIAHGAAAMPLLATTEAEPGRRWQVRGTLRDVYAASGA